MVYYFAPVSRGGQATAGQFFHPLMQSLSDRAGARVMSKASSLMGLVAWVGRTQLGLFRPFSTCSLHKGSTWLLGDAQFLTLHLTSVSGEPTEPTQPF